MIEDFQKFMGSITDEREKKMNELSVRLDEERSNRQAVQQALAFGIARFSPSASFSLAASTLAGTSLDLKEHYLRRGAGVPADVREIHARQDGNESRRRDGVPDATDGEKPKPIDPNELPPFLYRPVLPE